MSARLRLVSPSSACHGLHGTAAKRVRDRGGHNPVQVRSVETRPVQTGQDDWPPLGRNRRVRRTGWQDEGRNRRTGNREQAERALGLTGSKPSGIANDESRSVTVMADWKRPIQQRKRDLV